ncbi:MAG TPA: TraR/DksA C4-type zinc finger protein [Caulobacteraceae bacterium]|nr:TraR/DksA C4-type zinc finger protein [Caulobacteraceae bacterium]
MADDVDLAQIRVEQAREMAVHQVVSALRCEGAEACADCADPIEPERRQAIPSAVRCLFCQEALERGRRLYRSA